MALFWSRKPKAEKNYDKAAASATKGVPQQRTLKDAKTETVTKELAQTTEVKPVEKIVKPAIPSTAFSSATEVIIRPHVTEKTGILSQMGMYTFQVTANANKPAIKNAIVALYKVNPVKISIANLPSKHIMVKGKRGTVSGIRKAVVTLKKGEKIDFV